MPGAPDAREGGACAEQPGGLGAREHLPATPTPPPRSGGFGQRLHRREVVLSKWRCRVGAGVGRRTEPRSSTRGPVGLGSICVRVDSRARTTPQGPGAREACSSSATNTFEAALKACWSRGRGSRGRSGDDHYETRQRTARIARTTGEGVRSGFWCGRYPEGHRPHPGREQAASGPRSEQRSWGHLAFPWVTWGGRGP